MKIGLAQINPIVGDLTLNTTKILEYASRAAAEGADLVVFPELCVCGYPPMDLLEKSRFIEEIDLCVDRIAREAPRDTGLLIGAPVWNREKKGKRLRNAAILLENGQRVAEVTKTLLPTYDVFDEYRYFERADHREIVVWRGRKWGIHVCEDMWNNEDDVPYHLYRENPIDELAALGADIFVNISASPFSVGKPETRKRLVRGNCREHRIPFVLVNQVGANTEIVFDGTSSVHDAAGNCVAEAPAFEEALVIWDEDSEVVPSLNPKQSDIENVHDALVLGIRDYVAKTGFFSHVLIGLSGGIDSAVTCALAVEALGADRVVGVTMPSRFSSSGSVTDSRQLAANTGIRLDEIAISPAVSALEDMLHEQFVGTPTGVAEENIQARIRGVTLMALSNKFNYLVLTTGNKSEMAVGYATLYGDMNGGLAVLADIFKMRVYELANYINSRSDREIIPKSTIEKAPSAELRPDQTDQDSLPPYPVLDKILQLYIEEWLELDSIVERTDYDRELVASILRKVDANEYKRRQAAPGIKVSSKAFGVGRRVPIVMRWQRQLRPSE